MSKSLFIKGVALSVLASFAVTGVMAAEASRYKVRVGLTNVDPKSNNGTIAAGAFPTAPSGVPTDVQDDTAITFNGVYMINDNIGVELLAATPFDHDIDVPSVGTIGSTKHLPPTLSAQYYFPNESKFTPYVGLGLNYTLFFSEKLTSGGASTITTLLVGGPFGGAVAQDIKLDASFGLAYQIGVDYDIDENWLVNLDFRKMDIDTDVKLVTDVATVDIGEVNIDPTVISLNVGYKF